MSLANAVLESLVSGHGIPIQAGTQNRDGVAVAIYRGLVSDGVDSQSKTAHHRYLALDEKLGDPSRKLQPRAGGTARSDHSDPGPFLKQCPLSAQV